MPRKTVLAALALAACAPAPGLVGAPGVRIVTTEAEVAACTPVLVYTRTPGLFGPVVGEQALEYARNEVLAAAAADGADTVLFEEGGPNQPAYYVRARAYRC